MASFLYSSKKEDCSGCGACVQACGCHAISLIPDKFGFLYPVVDERKCVSCGLCKDVCPIDNPKLNYYNSSKGIAVGGYSNDKKIRAIGSSGGFFVGIVRKLWKPGTVVFGVEGAGVNSVKHSFTESLEDVSRFCGSKYLPSDTGRTFEAVREFLEDGRSVIYSGTPCQIAGLKSYLGALSESKRLFTIDLVCHGYFAPLYLKKEMAYYEKKFQSRITRIEWRNKDNGHWRNGSRFIYWFENGKSKAWKNWQKKSSPLHRAWLGHLICRPSCPECRFARSERVGDITLGDYWHVPESSLMYGGDFGTTVAFGNSPRGCEVLCGMSSEYYMERVDRNAITTHKFAMHGKWKPYPRMEEAEDDLVNLDYRQWIKKWTAPTMGEIMGNVKRSVLKRLRTVYKLIRQKER